MIFSDIVDRVRGLPDIRTETMRALRRDLSPRLASVPPGIVKAVANRLIDEGGIEYRFIAYELIHYHPASLESLRTTELERLGRGLDGWGPVDMFACFLAGPAWREHQISDATIHRWARSPDRWWRRAALVSTVPLNNKTRGGHGDARRTLSVCRLLVNDRDDMVVKAMSWALRELAKREPHTARRFLSQHEPRLAARILREVRNKLDTGLKNRRW